jgi:hypothetical protein
MQVATGAQSTAPGGTGLGQCRLGRRRQDGAVVRQRP